MKTRAFQVELGVSKPPTKEDQEAITQALARVLPALDMALMAAVGYRLQDVFIGLVPTDESITSATVPAGFKPTVPSSVN